jgi:hypothetical protein
MATQCTEAEELATCLGLLVLGRIPADALAKRDPDARDFTLEGAEHELIALPVQVEPNPIHVLADIRALLERVVDQRRDVRRVRNLRRHVRIIQGVCSAKWV